MGLHGGAGARVGAGRPPAHHEAHWARPWRLIARAFPGQSRPGRRPQARRQRGNGHSARARAQATMDPNDFGYPTKPVAYPHGAPAGYQHPPHGGHAAAHAVPPPPGAAIPVAMPISGPGVAVVPPPASHSDSAGLIREEEPAPVSSLIAIPAAIVEVATAFPPAPACVESPWPLPGKHCWRTMPCLSTGGRAAGWPLHSWP